MTAKNRWDERRAYDEAHAKQVSNAKDYTRLEEENAKLREEVDKLQDFTIWLWSGCFGHVENIRGSIVDIYEDWEAGKFDKKKEQGDE